MQLFEIRNLITETTTDYWNLLEVGPYFHDQYDPDSNQMEAHYHRAVFISDVDISIEWGMRVPDHDKGVTYEDYPWHDNATFTDPKIVEQWVDIFYRGSLVDRVRAMGADGHRVILPMPTRMNGGWATLRWERDLARLVDDLSGHRQFDRYISQLKVDHKTY